MQHFQFQTVGNIISGLGSISELKTVLTEKNYKRLLLVTDAGILATIASNYFRNFRAAVNWTMPFTRMCKPIRRTDCVRSR